MNETTPTTDWTALALEAMEQQQAEQEQQVAETAVAPKPHTLPFPLQVVMMLAKLVFLGTVGYFVVDRYGIYNLIWLAMVAWFIVLPTHTPHPKNAYK